MPKRSHKQRETHNCLQLPNANLHKNMCICHLKMSGPVNLFKERILKFPLFKNLQYFPPENWFSALTPETIYMRMFNFPSGNLFCFPCVSCAGDSIQCSSIAMWGGGAVRTEGVMCQVSSPSYLLLEPFRASNQPIGAWQTNQEAHMCGCYCPKWL